MVGTPATEISPVTLRAIQADHVGNVILTGRSTAGVAATAKVTRAAAEARLQRRDAGVPLFVSTDQEGGQVQVLRGPGFSAIPSALTQGTWSAAVVKAYAKKWGGQLQAAGVNVDLGPVLDTVPSPAAAVHNPPIGRFHREYGFTPALVSVARRCLRRRPGAGQGRRRRSSTSRGSAGSPATPTPRPG